LAGLTCVRILIVVLEFSVMFYFTNSNYLMSFKLLLLNNNLSSVLSYNSVEVVFWTITFLFFLKNKCFYSNAKGVILKALDQFRLKSCIDFKPREAEVFYITIQKLDGCYSYVGRRIAGGQVLSIGSGCDTKAIVEHEILRALGFYHEQSRYDRDDYVRLVRDNILQGNEHNFDKVGSDVSTTHGTLYDYWSVMHYSTDAFTNGNGPTIITIDPKFQNIIGQRLEMSYYDVLELNRLYNCSEYFKIVTVRNFNE
uniref:Metalloendopeptidase n=1 Tax=Oryzias latipes TaxID=8090 RepID=A0A3B3HIQ8_ORYLA